MMNRRKILFVLQSSCGGAERMTLLYAKILKNVFCVKVYAFGNKNVLLPFVDPSIDFVFHQASSALDGFIKDTRRIIKAENPDIVFCSLMPLNWRLAMACLGLKTKIVFRSDNYIESQTFIQKIRLALAYRKADLIIAQTEEMREGLIKQLFLPSHLVTTIPNPIDTEYINRKLKESSPFENNNKVRYVAVGRITRVKGFDMLIDSFKMVLDTMPKSELYILGDYNYDLNYTGLLKEKIKDYKLEYNIHFVGFTDNPYIYMKNADCFVLSSRLEGLPNVLIEALYCGTPCAAFTCIPVIDRILENGKTGYKVELGDTVGLSQAMLDAIKIGRVRSDYNYSESTIKETFKKL